MVEGISMNCPKCKELIEEKGFFQVPDNEGIIAVVNHNIVYESGMFGEVKKVGKRCFLNLNEAKEIFDIKKINENHYEVIVDG